MTDRMDAAEKAAIAAAQGAGASDVEISWVSVQTDFARFASSRFTQVGRTEQLLLRTRVIVDGRLGTQVCASAEQSEVERAARAAVDVARMSPPLDVALSFATPATAGKTTARADAPPMPEGWSSREAPGRLREAFDRARDVACAGSLKAYRRQVGVATARGLSRRFGTTRAELGVIAAADGSSGFAGSVGRIDAAAVVDIDIAGAVARAKETAQRGREPVEIEPGAYDVVLAPEAIAELIEWMAMASFGGTSLLDETSLLCGEPGRRLCDERIDLRQHSDPDEEPFDAEGIARAPVGFIREGKAGDAVTDLVTAARLGHPGRSTGHAPAVDSDASSGPTPVHVRLRPGTASESDLIRDVGRGIYVTRLHYVNGLLDTRRATMTGMTRDGTFTIENGALARGVKNMRFTENMLEALSERLIGVGRDPRDVPTWWSNAGVITSPAIALRGFRFTGKSR